MRTHSTSTRLFLVIALVTVLAGVASANVSGAIYTTTIGGTTVNGNIYDNKGDVYLSGGPQNKNAGGLDDGTYYFQVTDPSGAVLLSTDDVTCRQIVVLNGVADGVPAGSPPATCLAGVYHATGVPDILNGAITVQLMPYNDTPNNGGEYKAWVTPIADYNACGAVPAPSNNFCFVSSNTKTDNFKVKLPNTAYITVCKFQACTLSDDTGTCAGSPPTTDPLLSGWTINATGADQKSEVTTSGFGSATPFGCTTFTVSNLASGTTATVGLTEVLQPNWTETAPDGNTPNPTPSQCTVSSFADTCTVGPGDSIAAPNFGNWMGEAGVAPTLVKTANGSYNTTYTWTIAKSVDQNKQFTVNGGPATFNYTVTVTHGVGKVSNVQVTGDITIGNPNPFPITIDSVTDSLSDGTGCTVTGGTNVSVPASTSTILGSVDLPYSCTLSAVPTVEEDNTVLISWSDQTGTLNGVPWELTAGSLPFTFTNISFTNGVIDNSVTVTDTLDGGTPSTLGTATINPDGSMTVTGGTVDSVNPNQADFNFPKTFTDPAGTCTNHNNTATFTTNTSSTTGTSSPVVTVTDCQGADLTISKTAIPTFTRTYTWTIVKTNNQPNPVEQESGSVNVKYTITTGFTTKDSAWAVGGTITVTNPNDWEAITATVSDSLDTGSNCTYSPSSTVTVPAKSGSTPGSSQVTYSCSLGSGAGGTNYATASWIAATYFTPDGLATSVGVPFAFTTPTTTVGPTTITVTDSFNGGTAITLGTVNALTNTTTPNTNSSTDGGFTITSPSFGVFTYTRSIKVVSNCVTYNNTATIVETKQTANSSVEICGPAKTGALTMGYWQNKNGQGIISGQAKTGTCPSATWLRQYNPFSDLSPTATCSAVATYVYNVIKAATCGGSTCNAMLKAQMLATALDVYFSDPSLGGNKIGAPAPIGGVSIDLSSICSMIDGSGGTGTCSGSLSNVASLFGVTKCDTVSGMLAYQNTADPLADAGKVWYSNNKSNQTSAKNAFDAINNSAAFGCP
jgi:hypothetical protein